MAIFRLRSPSALGIRRPGLARAHGGSFPNTSRFQTPVKWGEVSSVCWCVDHGCLPRWPSPCVGTPACDLALRCQESWPGWELASSPGLDLVPGHPWYRLLESSHPPHPQLHPCRKHPLDGATRWPALGLGSPAGARVLDETRRLLGPLPWVLPGLLLWLGPSIC